MARLARNTGVTSKQRLAPNQELPPRLRRRPRLRYGLMDLLVVATCCLAFGAVIAARHGEAKTPPFDQIAQDLGTTPEAVKQAADRFVPRSQIGPPTDTQKQQMAIALDITVEQLEAVMEKYRPDRLRQR
ncbi:MAG: hypothetical protein ISP49_07630 [Reyranella sp.]|nr:hypothetical protein [Reyranella sp.]MBL6651446.1 hypothetical protein [Reyranella sp.]